MNFLDEEENLFENDLEIVDIIDFGFPRQTYPRSNHFNEMDNLTFFQRFRLNKATVFSILMNIENQLEYPSDIAGHLATVADFMGVHLSTLSRIIKRVSYALAGLSQQYINMPEGNTIARTQNEFFGIASFPRVLGCVDCTHIGLQSPGGEDAEIFRNRKGFFSINVQVVSDVTLKIRDIVVR